MKIPEQIAHVCATKPRIICLCGSTRFHEAYAQANLEETLKGNIVLTVGCMSHSDDALGLASREDWLQIKSMLDELHLRKIDLCDEVLVLNVGGYVGESTAREIAHAIMTGKLIRFFDKASL